MAVVGAFDLLPVRAGNFEELIRLIEAGMPIEALDRFHELTGIPIPRIATLIRIPQRTLARRREEGRLSAEESDRLVRVARLVAAATTLFAGSVPDAVEWLSKPLKALGGAIPFDIAETETGSYEVETVIGQLEHGVFA
jgi:putative toxin-antitoxin system antitoxin component (TIGR02293 family)